MMRFACRMTKRIEIHIHNHNYNQKNVHKTTENQCNIYNSYMFQGQGAIFRQSTVQRFANTNTTLVLCWYLQTFVPWIP